MFTPKTGTVQPRDALKKAACCVGLIEIVKSKIGFVEKLPFTY
jgi:hypothetical protein